MRSTIKILILDENTGDNERIINCLSEKGYTLPISVCDDEESFMRELKNNTPDVILCEHESKDINSFKANFLARKQQPEIIIILVSGQVTEEFAVELLNDGFDDYVMKCQLLRLPHAIESAIIKRKFVAESKKLSIANAELLCAYEIIEAKNKNVIQSIVFAERIQKLTFPKIDVLLKNFSESFILYKSKDIVSGDFYWFNDMGNDFLATVADCTGHGVSGALLSMIGYESLNEITQSGEKSPKQILSDLDTTVCKILKQSENEGYQDGIDLAFVHIDKAQKIIHFSGCKRPLFILSLKTGEINEYKGEPYLIGGIDKNVVKTFKTQDIKYDDGDVIYMFSDGYVDQFGGEDNRKFSKDRLIKMLTSIKHLKLEYQGQLLEQRFYKWKGELEQTDDILVIGIKL